jgi:hypothetical protein
MKALRDWTLLDIITAAGDGKRIPDGTLAAVITRICTPRKSLVGLKIGVGIITRELKPKKGAKNRALIVKFKCLLCGGKGQCRLSRLTSGRQKSCGCQKKKTFFDYRQRQISKLSDDRRRAIATSADSTGVSQTAREFGVSMDTVKFALQAAVTQQVDTLTKEQKQEIIRVSNKGSYRQVAETFQVLVSTIKRLRSQAKKQRTQEEALAAQQSAFHDKIWGECRYIDYSTAREYRTGRNGERLKGYVPLGELSANELRSFRWLEELDVLSLPAHLHGMVRDVQRQIRWTRGARQFRLQRFRKEWGKKKAAERRNPSIFHAHSNTTRDLIPLSYFEINESTEIYLPEFR